jgi:excisionase family DNA binding protein
MPKPDYSNWFTKQQAAEAVGVSTKTIEKLAQEKKIQQAFWKRPETGASVAVYHPDDVERERRERNPDLEPFAVPPRAKEEEQQTQALVVPNNDAGQLFKVLAAIASQSSQSAPDVRTAERLFLTIAEAARYSGLPRSYLKSLMTEGKLAAMKTGAGWRIRRSDLEKL